VHNQDKKNIENQLRLLKEKAGSHSPSISSLKSEIEGLEIKIDACFLSNPYATELFFEYLYNDLILNNRLKEVLEFYPSQNRIIGSILATTLQVSSNNVFIGNGATEIIQALIHNFTRRKILINLPTFSPYYEFVFPNVEIVYNYLDKNEDFVLDKEIYLKKVKQEKPDTVVFITPNNPDGGYIPKNDLEELLKDLKDVEQVIIDESFIHFAYENDEMNPLSYGSFVEKYPNVIIVKSFSKDFGIAGIRAGYALMAKEKVDHLLRHGYLWNVSSLAEYFFRLLADQSFLEKYEKIRVRYIKETRNFYELLKKIPEIKIYPSKANFFLIELLNSLEPDEMTFRLLLDHGIYCRSCRDKIGLKGNFIRIASRKNEENQMITSALKEVVQSRIR
jgi:histidinol-phosphate/aromatic aminotransferase/cobyric acid decarboxylase-like protein